MILACGLCTVLYCTVALVCAVSAASGRAPRLMRSGIYVGAVGLVLVVAALIPESEAVAKVAVVPSAWAVLMALTGLVLLPRRRPGWWTGARRASIVLLAMIAFVLCFTAVYDPGWGYAFYAITARIMAALALLAGAALAAMFLGVWIPGFAAPPEASGERLPFWLRCPRCATGQQATTGGHRCRSCGLEISVEVS